MVIMKLVFEGVAELPDHFGTKHVNYLFLRFEVFSTLRKLMVFLTHVLYQCDGLNHFVMLRHLCKMGNQVETRHRQALF